MPTMFSVSGPHAIEMTEGPGGKTILKDNIKTFWAQHTDIAPRRGCYVFCFRAGKGFTPMYVGKATRSFQQEVFASDKQVKYQKALIQYGRGTPVLFFVVSPVKKGAPNTNHIGELEEFLIQTGLAANENLLNIKGTKSEEWGIAGVIRGGKGKPSKKASEFRRAMKLMNK